MCYFLLSLFRACLLLFLLFGVLSLCSVFYVECFCLCLFVLFVRCFFFLRVCSLFCLFGVSCVYGFVLNVFGSVIV